MVKYIALFFVFAAQKELCAQTAISDSPTQLNSSSEKVPQNLAKRKKEMPRHFVFNLFFFNHSISVPFYRIVRTPLHPGVQAGMEGRYFETPGSKLFQTINLGAFYNKYNGTSFFMNTEFGYRYKTKFNLTAEVMAGLGYIRTYHPADIYTLNSGGTYEKGKDKGFSSALFSIATALGYSWQSTSAVSVRPFVRYQFLIQTHYTSDLDVLPHAAFGAGARFSVKRKNK